METKVNYTLAGTFVLVLLALITFGIIWLSAGFTTEKYVYYTVNMTEPVNGLNPDSPVLFNGVNVGTVSEMKINKDNPQIIVLTLKVKDDTPVTRGTRAKLDIRALTGVANLELDDKGTDKKLLTKTDKEPYPEIKTIPSIAVKINDILNLLKEGLQKLSRGIGSLLDDDNLRTIKQILHSLQKKLQ
jgi:phospholipid/cholesterol/gamma-HCH transport system substrate-binding protein